MGKIPLNCFLDICRRSITLKGLCTIKPQLSNKQTNQRIWIRSNDFFSWKNARNKMTRAHRDKGLSYLPIFILKNRTRVQKYNPRASIRSVSPQSLLRFLHFSAVGKFLTYIEERKRYTFKFRTALSEGILI